MTNSICTPKPHLSITIKSHSLHLVSLFHPTDIESFHPRSLFLSYMVLLVHILFFFLQSNLFSPHPVFFFFIVDTHTHRCTQYLSVTWLYRGQLPVGGSVGTLDKEQRKDSREKGDERGPSACPAAMQQQPDGTREKKQGFPKNPAQCLSQPERCACTRP